MEGKSYAQEELLRLRTLLRNSPLTPEKVRNFYEKRVCFIGESRDWQSGNAIMYNDSKFPGKNSVRIKFKGTPYRERFVSLTHEAIHGIYDIGGFGGTYGGEIEHIIDEAAIEFCDTPKNKRFLYDLLSYVKKRIFYN